MSLSKRFLAVLLVALFVSASAFASVGVKRNGVKTGAAADINLIYPTGTAYTYDGGTVSIPTVSDTMFVTGTGNGGATSMASNETAVPVSYAFVRKAIANDSAFDAGTLANGEPGQILSIYITSLSGGSRTYTVTPTTKTGFTSIAFNAVADQATLLYVDDTSGWVIIGQNSLTINP